MTELSLTVNNVSPEKVLELLQAAIAAQGLGVRVLEQVTEKTAATLDCYVYPTPPRVAHLQEKIAKPPVSESRYRPYLEEAIAQIAPFPRSALNTCRVTLEQLLQDLYLERMNTPYGTRDIKLMLSDLKKAKLLPIKVKCWCESVREMGNLGSHPVREGIKSSDAETVFQMLLPIIEWYETSKPTSESDPE